MADENPTDCLQVERLTSRMVRSEEDAYREFYHAYAHRLFRYLLVVTHGHEETAKEALQQTLLRVVRNIRRFDSEEAFWSWLTVLARSAATDQARRGRSYLNLLQGFYEQWTASGTHPEPEPSDRLNDHVDSSLASLSEEDRHLIHLKYLARTPVREIAEKLNTTEKAIESRLVRVRQRLKSAILERLQHETTA
ncbi:MAG: sigma-70 family RNA polymerase sigma factor [Verrucomicrobiales bacterium]|nr:sigma-70 family RNA polymerase sigma factor [Verrucomicrobiales bacterium]